MFIINKTANDLIQEVIDLEIYSLTNDSRSTKDKLDQLLSDDFIEYGASGKIYTKEDVLNYLPSSDEILFEVKDISATPLGVDVVQVKYILYCKTDNSYSLRSSIWEWSVNGWKMTFHQGTNSCEEYITSCGI